MNLTHTTSNVAAASLAPPPPPPPPPMPHEAQQVDNQLTIDLVNANFVKPHMKMRTLNWRRIPKRKVLCQILDTNKRVNATGISITGEARRQTIHVCHNQETHEDGSEREANDGEDNDKNVWFLIAKANKSIKELKPASSQTSLSSSTSSTNSKVRASKIREMLESVRRRMAAVTVSVDQSNVEPLFMPTTPAPNEERRPKNVLEAIDFDHLESLFCLNNQPSDSFDSESPNLVRRSSMRTNASSDSVISSNSCSHDSSNMGDGDDDSLFEFENIQILDSKKSLNVNIFLKQLKSPDELIDLINRDVHSQIGKDKLESLLKLLPNDNEKAQLMRFYLKNRQNRLPIAEKFLLQLTTEVPNLKLKIKFMLLQAEYHTDLEAIGPELDKIDEAAKEIRGSKMLRDVLNLVLVTGNFLNTGGYAADAAGFGLDCLERLSEVRSNKPGIYLIHYLSDVANKLGLIDFQQKELQHVELASRVCIESIMLDLNCMMDKIAELKCDADREAEVINEKESHLFLLNLLRTLDDIKSNVEFLKRRVTHDLEETRKQLACYLCEDTQTFKLHDCFHNIIVFSHKLKTAFEENERRQRLEVDRRSSCSLKRSNTISHKLLKGAQSRQSLVEVQPKQPNGFSYIAKEQKRSTLGNAQDLSRTTSSFNLSHSFNEPEVDDLHDGLMKLLDDRRTSDIQSRAKINSFGTYRRASRLFKSSKINMA